MCGEGERTLSLALNDALETLRQVLCKAFGPEESFGTIDYHEARRKLRLTDDVIPIPDVFVKAFAVLVAEPTLETD